MPVGPDSEERLDADESEKKDKEKEVKEEEEEEEEKKKEELQCSFANCLSLRKTVIKKFPSFWQCSRPCISGYNHQNGMRFAEQVGFVKD